MPACSEPPRAAAHIEDHAKTTTLSRHFETERTILSEKEQNMMLQIKMNEISHFGISSKSFTHRVT